MPKITRSPSWEPVEVRPKTFEVNKGSENYVSCQKCADLAWKVFQFIKYRREYSAMNGAFHDDFV